ncbi:MAG: HD domain-containing protein [Nitrospira sp.]|nr:HD domain-containing protein [Nitrospira sp.]
MGDGRADRAVGDCRRIGKLIPEQARSVIFEGQASLYGESVRKAFGSMNWYGKAEQELTAVAEAIQTHRPFRLEGIELLRDGLVSSLKHNDDLVVRAISGPAGSPLITNLINVAILGAKVGMGLGYYGAELDRLALAGLIHDIGLLAVPQSLVTKAGRLTQEERMMIEQHPELGCQLVQRLGAQYEWLAQVVLQAHERFNGKGYPNRLQGGQVGEMAQIIGVVDVFDALVSERPYRRRLFPHEAVKELLVTERTAFPREVLKALVEQLTVYPLGTTVRLTTGETARVCRVNSKYPLRPSVEICEDDSVGQVETRHVDLSLTPLLSILETVNSPVMRDVSPVESPIEPDVPSSHGAASDQFTSLLESLDAIVSAIQGVVETRMAGSGHISTPSVGKGHAGELHGVTQGVGDRTFQTEIIGLFALEAHEWLSQIQTALKKLGAGAEGSVRSKLYGFILNGITNLGRSASTVQLAEIEAMASNLLPILRDVGRTESQWTAETLRPLHQGLDRIADAVRRLAGENGGVGRAGDGRGKPDPFLEVPVGCSGGPSLVSAMSQDRPGPVGSTMPLLRALRELQQARARSMQPARDVLESVIQRAQDEVGEGQDQVTVEIVQRILHDLERLDEEFLREIQDRVPAVIDRISHLRQSGNPDGITAAQLDPILGHVDALTQCAKTIDAETMTMFLQGVKSFLTSAASRTVATLPERLQAAEERVRRIVPMAEQWVTLGRLERASIEDILPA